MTECASSPTALLSHAPPPPCWQLSPVLSTQVLTVALSSDNVPLLGDAMDQLLVWLPRLPDSRVYVNQRRAHLPPYSCLNDRDCSGSSWQNVPGECVSGRCVCPAPTAGIDCARVTLCHSFDEVQQVWRSSGCVLRADLSDLGAVACVCPGGAILANQSILAGVEQWATRPGRNQWDVGGVNLPRLDSDAWLLDVGVMFSSRLLPVTLPLLLLDFFYVLMMVRSLTRSNERSVKAHADLYGFWIDARRRMKGASLEKYSGIYQKLYSRGKWSKWALRAWRRVQDRKSVV